MIKILKTLKMKIKLKIIIKYKIIMMLALDTIYKKDRNETKVKTDAVNDQQKTKLCVFIIKIYNTRVILIKSEDFLSFLLD